MLRRVVDVTFAGLCLAIASPILLVVALAVWLQDFHSPIYRGVRVGQGGKHYQLLKFRSMVVDAEKTRVDTTSENDPRVTRVGRFIRRFKLDELPQFVNVLKGDMSIVGPRPLVLREAAIHTDVEKQLFSVKPGITDLSSIVFSDLGEIVANEPDADIAYNQLVRPWKSRLGLLYIDKQSLPLDAAIVLLTVANFFARPLTLKVVARLLNRLGAAPEIIAVAERKGKLQPSPPPGSNVVVQNRNSGVTL